MAYNTTLPKWVWAATALGLAWNLFGVVQFLQSASGDVGSLMRSGLTRDQAELYLNLPIWMTVAFALGVFGGVVGSALLLLRRRISVPVLWTSLVAYLVLYVGDITEGVFAAFGAQQIVILTTVLAIAAAMLWLASTQKTLQRLR